MYETSRLQLDSRPVNWRLKVVAKAFISQCVLAFVFLTCVVRFYDNYVGATILLPARLSGLGASMLCTPHALELQVMHSSVQIATIARLHAESFSGFVEDWTRTIGNADLWTVVPPIEFTATQNARMSSYHMRLSFEFAGTVFCIGGLTFLVVVNCRRRGQRKKVCRHKVADAMPPYRD